MLESTEPGVTRVAEKDADQLVLDRLAELGSDLSMPHAVRFYSYFASESAAEEAADQLKGTSFAVELMPSAHDKGLWLVRSTLSIIPTLDNVKDAACQVEEITVEHGGEYDGWEAPLTGRTQ
jgi:hypothetical protein